MKRMMLIVLACMGFIAGNCSAEKAPDMIAVEGTDAAIDVEGGNQTIADDETDAAIDVEESNQTIADDDNLPDELSYELPEDLPQIDFDELRDRNPDIYAWIYIPDTVVSYPILRSGPDLEEDYYLDHTVDHVAGYPGSIFTELYNGDDFTDVNTVIYGHNMRDGSMFGSLAAYKKIDYLLDHRNIYICTQEGWFVYEIACGVVYDDGHVIYNYKFGTYPAFDQFLDALYGEVEYKEECAYALERDEYDSLRDTLLTLVTCVNGNRPENRFYLVARLVDGPETALARIKEKRMEQVKNYIYEIEE